MIQRIITALTVTGALSWARSHGAIVVGGAHDIVVLVDCDDFKLIDGGGQLAKFIILHFLERADAVLFCVAVFRLQLFKLLVQVTNHASCRRGLAVQCDLLHETRSGFGEGIFSPRYDRITLALVALLDDVLAEAPVDAVDGPFLENLQIRQLFPVRSQLFHVLSELHVLLLFISVPNTIFPLCLSLLSLSRNNYN